MQSQWNDNDAEQLVSHYAKTGIVRDVALRVYTSRLLGRDPQLVLHGGGNTSVKTTISDFLDQPAEVLCVKGSGWDLADIEPAGLPAVRLAPLLQLRKLEGLNDEKLMAIQRVNLIDPSSPNPSVETLLHALLPHKFVDHTHAAAVLSLADQKDAESICREVFGNRAALVPYVMPGFALAKKAAMIFDGNANVQGLILLKHGIFAFGDSAQQSYERMIDLVTLAEGRLGRTRKSVFISRALPVQMLSLSEVAPILRGGASTASPTLQGAYRRPILEFRASVAILNYVNGAGLDRYSQVGPVTPDHTIRTKNVPLIVPIHEGNSTDFKSAIRSAMERYTAGYNKYFDRNNAKQTTPRRRLDAMPRVALVPGLGLFGLGSSAKDARIAADIAEITIQTITDAEAIGRYESLKESDLFDMEYWSLEQAKLGKAIEKPLAGQIALITGGAGAIGAATANLLAQNGAEVALLDVNLDAARDASRTIPGSIAVACDVTSASSVAAAFDAVVGKFGGVDIVVSNAGAAWQGRIGEISEDILRKSFELNFFAHQKIAQAAVRIMLAQGTGEALLFNVSKQAINPGPDFGPYGLPKAATLFLVRQYALEYGKDGIRANAVNADRIRSGILTDEMIAARAKSRGVSEQDYLAGNLLHREVTAGDVAQAFLNHALALKTTADITTVDGGNIAAAVR